MKCICGYEYEKDHWDKEEHPDKGDEKFVDINGNFIISNPHDPFNVKQVRLSACPKCNTVQMVRHQ